MADAPFAATLIFDAPRTVEEADQLLKVFHASTGNPLVVSPVVYEAMKARGIDLTHVKRNDPLPVC